MLCVEADSTHHRRDDEYIRMMLQCLKVLKSESLDKRFEPDAAFFPYYVPQYNDFLDKTVHLARSADVVATIPGGMLQLHSDADQNAFWTGK